MGTYGLDVTVGPFEVTSMSDCVIPTDEVLECLFQMGQRRVVFGAAAASTPESLDGRSQALRGDFLGHLSDNSHP